MRLQRDWRIASLSRKVAAKSHPNPEIKPVAFFNASSRLSGFSQNAAFTLLTTWAVQLAGAPVVTFGCQSGMDLCLLGTDPDDPTQDPPCEGCIAQSHRLFDSTPVWWFEMNPDPKFDALLGGLSIEELKNFEYTFDPDSGVPISKPIPFGPMVLTSLRWALRRHHLQEDNDTRLYLRRYIRSAHNIAREFSMFLDEIDPGVVIVFNGLQYPERVARWIAKQRGYRVLTQEVGFQPFSTFITEGQSTAYPIEISDDFDLNTEQRQQIDDYLSQRFKGDFTMAGIRFWPEMSALDQDLRDRMAEYQQIVPVFTNVIFDTSQAHANVVFDNMFDWLDVVLELIEAHPETFFVIRAHPDEKRPGTRKHSREAVSEWVAKKGIGKLHNVLFIDSQEYLSSYELIRLAKFVMVYNSSIGLEATLLGTPVLTAGKARYTQYPIVYFPENKPEFRQQAEDFLSAEQVEVLDEHHRNALRFLYYQLHRVSIPLGEYIEAHPTPGYVQLKQFNWRKLTHRESVSIKVIVDGILKGKPFLMPENEAR